MSSRLRNLFLTFGISIVMWAAIIQGTTGLYAIMSSSSTVDLTTASIK